MDMVMYIYNHLSVTNIKQRRILTMGIFKSSSRKLLLFSLLLSCLYSCCRSQTLTDTIKPGDTLGPTDTLTSENGRFILKFFNFSDNGYLGIWIGNNKAVWIANGSVPLVRTGNLTMDADGVLTVMDNGGNKFALNPSFASPSSTATLQNSGNFVVTELNADGSTKQILWQSFDYPTDTLLPSMKLGVNHKTGQTWRLTSWLIDQLPGGGGGFSLDWNSTGTGELVIRRLGQVYWNSGAITSDAVQNLPQLSSNANKPTFTVVSNDDESSFSYAVAEGSTSWWVLSPTGDLTNFEDGIGQFLLLEGACDGAETADTNLGCVKQDVPECRSSDEAFERKAGVFSGQGQPWAFGSASIGPVDCWKTCWTNCSCIGYDVIYSNQTWCRTWNVSAIFTPNESGDQSAIHVLSSPSKSKDNKWWIWVVVSVAAVLLALISTFLWYLRRKKLQREEEEALFELAPTDRLGDVNEIGNDGKKGHDLKVFTFSTITAATDNFSSRNKLGQGGFGPVYKGKLPEGQEIAVKRLSRSSGQGLEEFKNELILIAKLQHMNLVRLIGCCVKGDEKMLVYEFMPNKSLDFFLFDPTKREILDWKRRFNIIEGTAQGILYLHKYSRLRIIHRDLKASNILLDKDMQPKISDFGMARIFGRNESEANTNRVVGTYGYMSPEYAMEGNFSEKSDVYSFGVLLLEIASGRKNSSGFQYNDRPLNLVGYAFELWRQGKSLELMDSMLAGSKSIPQIQRCIHVGLLCVQEFAADRPTMSEVVAMLTNDTVPLPMPNQAASAPTAHKISELSLAESERESCSIKMSDVQDMAPR